MVQPTFFTSAVDAGAAVSNAWELLKGKYGLYLGVALLAILMSGCIPCLSLFMVGPVLAGIYFVVLRDMRGEPVEFGMMFRGFDKFVPLMVIGLIQAIPGVLIQGLRIVLNLGQLGLSRRAGSGGFFQSNGDILAGGVTIFAAVAILILLVAAIIWAFVFYFAIPLAMEYDLGPLDAIKLSARAASKNIGGLILVFLLEIAIGIGGVLLLCVGSLLLSLPLIYIVNAFVYRQVFPSSGQSGRDLSPPPPTLYGGNYGMGV